MPSLAPSERMTGRNSESVCILFHFRTRGARSADPLSKQVYNTATHHLGRGGQEGHEIDSFEYASARVQSHCRRHTHVCFGGFVLCAIQPAGKGCAKSRCGGAHQSAWKISRRKP